MNRVRNESGISLYLYVNKSNVKVGEGLKVSMGLYVPIDNTIAYDFSSRFNTEVQEIANKIEPSDCFISRKDILNIKAENVTFFGKPHFNILIIIAYCFMSNYMQFGH